MGANNLWLRLDSRILEKLLAEQVTSCDIESLAEIYNYRSIRWKEINTFTNQTYSTNFEKYLRKLPIIKQLVYELEIFFYKYKEYF